MKYKTPKLRQLEKNRYSVFYELDKCMNCGSTYQMTIHEIFEGKNRRNSMLYGFTLPLCLKCHRNLQDNKEFNEAAGPPTGGSGAFCVVDTAYLPHKRKG